MRFILLALLAGCGGSTVEWAGKWRQPVGIAVASYVECTLGGSGTAVAGSGIQHREAGTDLNFTIAGTAAPVPGFGVTFTYDGGTTEGFSFAQPDSNHITLTNPQRTVPLVRQ